MSLLTFERSRSKFKVKTAEPPLTMFGYDLRYFHQIWQSDRRPTFCTKYACWQYKVALSECCFLVIIIGLIITILLLLCCCCYYY